MARKKAAKAERRFKKVNAKIIKRMHGGKETGPYTLMDELIDKHHHQVSDAKILLAWGYNWKPGIDGQVKLVKVMKGGDLDRDKNGFDCDFIIVLNADAWPTLGEDRQPAVMDHGLCHCEVAKDRNGEVLEDDNHRTVYRLRRPDLVEFIDVVARHGQYTATIAKFVTQATKLGKRPLFDREEQALAKQEQAEAAAQDKATHAKASEAAAAPSTNGHANGHAKPKNRVAEHSKN